MSNIKINKSIIGITFTVTIVAALIFVTDTFSLSSASYGKKDSFAVVELFTSEGCSSCPPADKVLSELIKEAREKDLNIYGLSFHVDYWNYIGWQDPYSDKKYSNRQRAYGQAFHNNRIYTPQMIVNGQEEFVGSNQIKAENSVREALSNSSSLKISTTCKNIDNKVTVDYAVPDLPPNTMVNLALVENNLSQNVKRGENSGRLLKHENVVRNFQVFRSNAGTVNFDLSGIKIDNASVIAYVQDANSMKILGAEGIPLHKILNKGKVLFR